MTRIRRMLILAAVVAGVTGAAIRPVISADSKPAASSGGVGINISKGFEEFAGDIELIGNVYSDNPKDPNAFRFSCDKFLKANGVVHLVSTSDKMAWFEMKGERRKFTAKKLVWDGQANTLTLTTRAKIIQTDEKGNETLNITGDSIVILMGDQDEMRIKIHRSDQPGSPKARLKMKDSTQLGSDRLRFLNLDTGDMTMNRSGFYTIAGRLLLGTVMTAGIGLVAIGASTESPSSKPDSSDGGSGLFGGSQGQNGALDLSAYDIEVVIKNNKFDELNASGEVQLDKDGMKLSSDQLTYDPINKKMIAKVVKSPRVRIQSKDASAVCGRAIYDMARNIYNLSGGCVITQAGRETKSDSMNIVNDNGKMRAIASSSTDSALGGTVDANGKRSVTSQRQEDAIKNIQETLGISEEEARAQFAGKNTPAQIEIDQNAKSSGTTGASQSSTTGIIKGDTWDRVPGGPSKGLEVEN